MKGLALILAVVFLLLAIESWFSIVHIFGAPHHFKHMALFLILGLLSLVWLRFSNTETSATSRR